MDGFPFKLKHSLEGLLETTGVVSVTVYTSVSSSLRELSMAEVWYVSSLEAILQQLILVIVCMYIKSM